MHKYVKLKNAMIASIFAKGHARSLSIPAFTQTLQEFVRSQQPSSYRRQSAVNSPAANAKFLQQVSEEFPIEERAGLARAVIRRLDTLFEYHCTVPLCGIACTFARQRCPYEHCGARFSRKYWIDHDDHCQHKPVTCPLLCGVKVPRRDMNSHVEDACVMRPVPCTFAHLGCRPVGKSYCCSL